MTKVAAIQMCSSNIVEENLAIASKLITEAARNDAKLIVLPEMFAIMGLNPMDRVTIKETFGHGMIQSFLSEQAKNNAVWIVGGTIPIQCSNNEKVSAASLLYDAQGTCIARYDKIHLFDVKLSENEEYNESATIEAGNDLIVADTPFGKLGIAVCYDIRFPELFRCLLVKGAEIIAIPAAFTAKTGEAHWELLARCRAIDNFCYIIGACQGGTHANKRKTFGNSLIVAPWGEIIAKKQGTGEGIIYSDIDLAKVHEARKTIPIVRHQKIFFDTSLMDSKRT